MENRIDRKKVIAHLGSMFASFPEDVQHAIAVGYSLGQIDALMKKESGDHDDDRKDN